MTATMTQRHVPASALRAGHRITIGRYRVELVAEPTPAPRRLADGYLEVMLLVRDVPTPDNESTRGLWSVTVGADQLFTLL